MQTNDARPAAESPLDAHRRHSHHEYHPPQPDRDDLLSHERSRREGVHEQQ